MPTADPPIAETPLPPHPESFRDRSALPKINGGGEGGRTPYLVNAIHTLSQMSYTPTCVKYE